MLQNGKKVMKKKTSMKKDTRSPVFNEAMIFSVPAPALHVRCQEKKTGRIGNESEGRRIGSEGEEGKEWEIDRDEKKRKRRGETRLEGGR